MKKIFSLLCAALTVLSATAMPVLSKAEAGKKTPEAISLVSQKDFVKQMQGAMPMRKAPAAVYDIVCDSYHAEDYTATDGDWYIAMQGEGLIFIFDIYTTELESGKTYTFADMEPEYTGVGNAAATDATFTVTYDTDGLAHVVAQMVAANNTYNLTFDETPAIEHTWGEWTPFAPKGEATGDYTHTILFTSPAVVRDLDVNVRYATDEPTLAQVKVSNWGAGPLSTYGVDFIFEWNTETNTCVVPDQFTGYTHSSYGEVSVADVSVWQGVNYYSIFPCTYDPVTATFSLSLVYKVSAGQFGYSGDTSGNTAETLVMNSPAVAPTGDTISYTITRNAKWVDYAASQKWFQLYQNDGHMNASISTLSSTLNQGEFFNADLDPDYTYLAIDGTKLAASDLHAVVTIDADKVVTGVLYFTEKTEGVVYAVTMVHNPALPIPLDYDEDSDVEMVFHVDDIIQNSASGNNKKTISFQAVNDDNEVMALTLYASTKDADITIPEGEYTFASTKAAGTALISTGVSSSGSVNRSYLATKDEEGYLDLLWFLVEGKVTVEKVTIDEKPALYMVVEAKNSWGFDVKATVGTKPSIPTAIDNNESAAQATKMMKNGQLVIVKNGKAFNAMGAEL